MEVVGRSLAPIEAAALAGDAVRAANRARAALSAWSREPGPQGPASGARGGWCPRSQ